MSEPTDANEAMQPAAEPVTEPATGLVTEPVTGPVTEPVTGPVTEPAADAATLQQADEEDAPAGAPVDPDVADALASLADRPLAEHAEVYEELHVRLQRTLAEIDGG
ncbi:MAG TPA: hypothetical protein VKQ07_05120 [Jatrophihabitantaceae bacterium]|nr:hypothetical protein [Jatrophihabitantaceae bacterium]